MVHLEMELRGVLHGDIVNDDVGAAFQAHQMGSEIVISQQFLVIQDADDPPVVAPAVDLTPTPNSQIRAVMTTNKILVIPRARLRGPPPHQLRCRQLALDHNSDIVDVVHADWERVEGALGDLDDALLGCGGIGGMDGG